MDQQGSYLGKRGDESVWVCVPPPLNDNDYLGYIFYWNPPLLKQNHPLGVPNGSSQWGEWAPLLLPNVIFPSKGNCYRHVCNKPVKYPEDEHDANPEGFTDFLDFTCGNLLAGAKTQGAKSTENGKCPKCYHKAMLYISLHQDNIWMLLAEAIISTVVIFVFLITI